MHKLVILFEPVENPDEFETRWPKFLKLAEEMPGLRREAFSRVTHFLYGQPTYTQVHELFFDNQAAAEFALESTAGQLAGQLLQQMTNGRINLFIAEHKEDVIENIQKYKAVDGTE